MKKIILLFAFVAFVAQNIFASYPQCRNTSGSSSPNAPTTIYLGDYGTFGCETWGTLDSYYGKIRVVTSKSADMSSPSYGSWGSYVNTDAKTNTSATFTSTGTWYWAIQTDYNGVNNYWYCQNDANWYNMWGTPTSNLTVTVSALNDPTATTPFTTTISTVALVWSKDTQSHNVMIIRKKSTDSWTEPTQGTAYTVGTPIGSGMVVYNSSATSFNDTGLTPSTAYDYKFYSENNSYYSAGVTASATTATQTSAATDYFRSKVTGNWSTASNWESSPDNTNWITSTLVPGATANSIKILNGHTITLDQDATVPNLTINTGGAFIASDGTARLLTISSGGTLANSGTFTPATGTVALVGTGTVTGTIGFYNVNIAGGVDFGSASTINGTLQINAGGYVNTNAPTYASGSTLKYYSGTTYGRGTEWSATSGVGYPYNVQLSNNTTVDMGANLGVAVARQCAGNLVVDAGSTFTMNGTGNQMSTAVTVVGNVTNSGTLTLSSTSGGDLKIQGNLIDNGAFNANTRAVFFTGTGEQDISGSGTFKIDYIVSNKASGSIKMGCNLLCEGPNGGNAITLTNTTDILDLNGYTLTLGKSGVTSVITGSGYIKGSSSSSVSILGTGAFGTLNFDQTTQGTSNLLSSLTIDRTSSGTVTLGDNLVCNTLTITNGTLNVNPTIQLKVSSTMTNNGILYLLSNSTSTDGTAIILTPSSISGSGTTKVQQYLSSARNWYISSPVTGATIPSGQTYYSYLENGSNVGFTTPATAYWKANVAPTTLAVGTGYIAQPASSTTLEFSGTLNTGTVGPLTLSRTSLATKSGFNLVGNPFPAYLNIDGLASNSNLEPTYWYKSYNSGYVFDTYNIPSALSTGLSGLAVSKYVPPMQAFWLRVANGKTSASVSFSSSDCNIQDDSNNKFRAPVAIKTVQKVLRLDVTNQTSTDETILYFNPNASDGFDVYDSHKLSNDLVSIPEIFTTVGSEQLAINGMQQIPLNAEIPLYFVQGNQTSFTLKATEFSNFDSTMRVILKDKLNNNLETDITDGTAYSFNAIPNASTDRFSLIFRTSSVTTGVQKPEATQFSVISLPNHQLKLLFNSSLSGEVVLYNAVGQQMIHQNLNGTSAVLGTSLPTGVYVLNLYSDGKSISRKVIIE